MVKKREIDNKQVGKEIAKRRNEMGITIQQLADKAKLHPAFLIQLEGGEIEETIDASVVYRIAEALNTTIADLYNLPVRCMKDGKFYWRMPKDTDFKPVEEETNAKSLQ